MTLRASHVSPRLTAAPWLVAFLTIVTTGCATNSGQRQTRGVVHTAGAQIAIGQQADADIRRDEVADNPELQRYVADIGGRLAALSHRPNLPWSFTVVDHPAINAFALPAVHLLTRGTAVPRQRGRACRGSRTRDRARHGAPRLAALPARRPAASASRCSASSCRRRSRSAISRQSGWAWRSSNTVARTKTNRIASDDAAKAGWDPSGVPRFLSTLARVDFDRTRRAELALDAS